MRAELPRLKVSENRRFLAKEDGSPFFWMGDTAWSLRKLSPEDQDYYLTHRAQHGFNVLQVYCGCQQVPWISPADRAGNRPFLEDDTDRPNEPFWRDTMDPIVRRAHAYGLYLALVPIWGMEYGPAFDTDADKAFRLGKWLGARYASSSHVLWISSGEYDSINRYVLPITAEQKSLFTALGRGLRDGHKGANLTTIHPGVAYTSSLDFHQEEWLDFNMLQSGHEDDREAFGHPENHTSITHDYNLDPPKPVLDGEPFYENALDGAHALKDFHRPRGGADVVRRKAYWAVFAGGCGHTYGHVDVQVFQEDPDRPAEAGVEGHWKPALDASGALQMKHLRALMEAHPFGKGIPDRSLLASPRITGRFQVQATRAADGSYALIYLPAGGAVTVHMDKLQGATVRAAWFDPRTGTYTESGIVAGTGQRSFTAPGKNALGNDWVLVLEASEKIMERVEGAAS